MGDRPRSQTGRSALNAYWIRSLKKHGSIACRMRDRSARTASAPVPTPAWVHPTWVAWVYSSAVLLQLRVDGVRCINFRIHRDHMHLHLSDLRIHLVNPKP